MADVVDQDQPAAEAVRALREALVSRIALSLAFTDEKATCNDIAKRIVAEHVAPLLADIAALRTRAEAVEKERDERDAIITAWESAASGLEAHLQDRIAMKDEANPAAYLSIWQTDLSDLTKRSRQIYAATQHRAAEGHRQALKAEAVAEAALKRSRLANARADAAEARADELQGLLVTQEICADRLATEIADTRAEVADLREAFVGLDQRIWTDPQEIERAGEWRTFIARALTTAKGDANVEA